MATNADLEKLVKKGAFREDLLYRLQRLQIDIPPLRERESDILLLAEYFMNEGREGEVSVMSDELEQSLLKYLWRGNVRELKNVIERMRLMNSDKLEYDVTDFRSQQGENQGERAVSVEILSEDNAYADGNKRTRMKSEDIDSFLREGNRQMRRLEKLGDLFQKYKKLTRKEIAQIMGISLPTATKDLKQLCDEGLIRKVKPTPSSMTHYFELQE